MNKMNINTIEMTRSIRDAHLKQLQGKPQEEWAEFYREKASKLEAPVRQDASKPQPEHIK